MYLIVSAGDLPTVLNGVPASEELTVYIVNVYIFFSFSNFAPLEMYFFKLLL